MFYPAQLNVYGGNSLPQISYQYDVETSSWKKHYNIYDHQGTLQQQYKFVNAPSNPPFNIISEPTLMQAHYPFGETRWEMDDLAEENKSTLNWIGKQKDKENGLGDHGVRKYEYETGRFTSIDPLWNKYYGWTPYQYSMNSPVGIIDKNGKNGVVVVDEKNETVTLKATYIVNNETYTMDDRNDMHTNINHTLNSQNYTLTSGDYEGFSVNFDLDFVYSEDFISVEGLKHKGVNIGNRITQQPDLSEFKRLINTGGKLIRGVVAGATYRNREIGMNPDEDNTKTRIHEIFHTLFYDNDGASKGVGKYGNETLPNETDINNTIYNEELPKINKNK